MLVEGFEGVSAVACGSEHAGFVADGTLYTFGSNSYNQLGWDSDEPSSGSGAGSSGIRPVTIEAEDGHRPAALGLSLGAFHSAAVTEGGALWTFGWGGSFWGGAGALGLGTSASESEPTLVQRIVGYSEEVRQVACGDQHTLVLTDQGRLYSTGKGEYGRLGRGETDDCLDVEEMDFFFHSNDSILNPSAMTRIVKIDSGSNFSAALSSDGELWLWGRNDYGQLGQGIEACQSSKAEQSYPRLIRTLPLEGHRIVDFACGRTHVVALTAAGAIYEWGNREFLEPSPLTLPSRYEEGLKNVLRVLAGDRVSFALTSEGRLYSWGLAASGCLAQGPDCPEKLHKPTLVPTEVFGGQRVVDLAAGPGRCLAITVEQ